MVKLSPLFKLQHRQLPHLYVGVSYLDLLERYSLLNTQTTILTMQTVFGQLTVQKENLLDWNLTTLILSTTAPASKLCTAGASIKGGGHVWKSVGAHNDTSFAFIPGIICCIPSSSRKHSTWKRTKKGKRSRGSSSLPKTYFLLKALNGAKLS